jgi:ParB/RepB/Spo0J family partition protein
MTEIILDRPTQVGDAATGASEAKEQFSLLPLEQIEPDPHQPRKIIGNLDDLVASIQTEGVFQPIVVRPLASGGYRIVFGERRFRCCQALGLATIPAIIRHDLSQPGMEARVREIQLAENDKRKDLTPLETAAAYQDMIQEFGYTQAQLGQRIGKSQNAISEALKLLKLSPAVQEDYFKWIQSEHRNSDVSASVLLEIAKHPSEDAQRELWEQAKQGELKGPKVRAERPKLRSSGSKKNCHPTTWRFTDPCLDVDVIIRSQSKALDREFRITVLEYYLKREMTEQPAAEETNVALDAPSVADTTLDADGAETLPSLTPPTQLDAWGEPLWVEDD